MTGIPGPAASALDVIRADLRAAADGGLLGTKAGDYLPAALARHSSSLLAAVEAALKAADHWDREGYRLDAEAFMVCAAALREAIAAALTGKEADDER